MFNPRPPRPLATSFCIAVFEDENPEDPGLFDGWVAQWRDLVDFEIVPVVSSAEAAHGAPRLPPTHRA